MPNQITEFDEVVPPRGIALSDREREIVQWIAAGARDAAIAQTMELSVRTVKWTVATLNERMGTHNRPHLVAWALRRKLIP